MAMPVLTSNTKIIAHTHTHTHRHTHTHTLAASQCDCSECQCDTLRVEWTNRGLGGGGGVDTFLCRKSPLLVGPECVLLRSSLGLTHHCFSAGALVSGERGVCVCVCVCVVVFVYVCVLGVAGGSCSPVICLSQGSINLGPPAGYT